jgi:hypothetical protein
LQLAICLESSSQILNLSEEESFEAGFASDFAFASIAPPKPAIDTVALIGP